MKGNIMQIDSPVKLNLTYLLLEKKNEEKKKEENQRERERESFNFEVKFRKIYLGGWGGCVFCPSREIIILITVVYTG